MSLVHTRSRHDPIWPLGIIVVGLSLTLSWTALLAYGLVRILEHAI